MDFDTKYFDHPDFSSEEKKHELLVYRINELDYNEKYLNRSKQVCVEGLKSLPVLKEESLIKAFKTFNLYRKLTSEGHNHRNDVAEWREKLIMHNISIIPFALRKVKECEELFSIGYMALHKSVDYFDVSRGYAFMTYASRGILRKCFDELKKDISKRMMTYPVEPLSAKFIEECDQYENQEHIMTLLDLYASPVEKEVIIRYYGLNGEESQSSRIIARHYNISPTRVRQIKERGIGKIRVGLANRSHKIECIGQS